MTSVRPGETFIWGQTRETAQALLAASERLGLDAHSVRTTENGFVVPDAVADEAATELHADPNVQSPIPSDQSGPAEEF